ncbi:MAG: DUF559 domain-containing protein [Candidatus Paceibacterota bacterium]
MNRIAWNKGRTKFRQKPCLCGCGNLVALHKYHYEGKSGFSYLVSDFIKGHQKRGVDGFNPNIHEPHLCECGCGKYTNKFRGRFNKFIKGHENIGRIPWNKNGSFSEASKKRMSLARLGKEPANKEFIDSDKLFRFYVSDKKSAREVSKILNISYDSVKNRLRNFGWSRTTKETCSEQNFKDKMRRIRISFLSSDKKIDSPNKLEKTVYDYLDRNNIFYKKQVPLFNKFVVDVLFPKNNVVLEIFGRYWHTMPKIVNKDISKKKYLEKCGYRVEEIWDYEIKNNGLDKTIDRVIRKYSLI